MCDLYAKIYGMYLDHPSAVGGLVIRCSFIMQESDEEDRREREKKERIEKSLRNREEEVLKTLSTSLRERDKEREQHKRDEAIQHFKALLADLVSLCLV